jgi:hypothetical protein
MRTSLLLVLPLFLAACAVRGGGPASTNEGDSTGTNTGSPAQTPEISLQAALQGLIQAEGADQVKATIHQFVASKLTDPTALAQVDAQVDPAIDTVASGGTLPPFPVVPFSILPSAQAIFAQETGQDPAAPPPSAFNIDPSTSSCTPVRNQLTPVSGVAGLQTGDLDNPNIDDCTLAHLQAFVVALNGLAMGDGTTVTDGANTFTTVSDVVNDLLQTHTVTVEANRYFANFLGLYFNGQSIAAPVWMDTGIPLPSGGTLVVPAPHSGYSLQFSGPSINGTVEFYMGLNVGTMFYAIGSPSRPAWSGGRAQYTYQSGTDNAKILQVVSTASDLRKKWTNQALAEQLPGMGYGILGVCMDSAAVIEEQTEGMNTLFPLAHPQPAAINDYIDTILAGLPTDLAGFDPNEAQGRIATSMPMSMTALQQEFPLVATEMQSLNLSW